VSQSFHFNWKRAVLIALVSGLALIGTVSRVTQAAPATPDFDLPLPNLIVTTTAIADDPSDGKCDLWEALQAVFQANSGLSPTYHECTAKVNAMNIIGFSVVGGTITLPTAPGSRTDLPLVHGNTVIVGPIAIAGGGAAADTHLLRTASGATLTVIAVSLKDGHTSGAGAAIYSDNYATVNVIGSFLIDNTAEGNGGGAIYANGNLNLMGASFIGNTADGTPGRGGAVYVTGSGSFKSEASTFTNNTAVSGGAVYLEKSGGEAGVNDSIFTGNTATMDPSARAGGAICNTSSGGTLTIQRTAFNINLATEGKGGALFNDASATTLISDTLFNGNIAGNSSHSGEGGAIANQGELSIAKSTFLANSIPLGGGGAVDNSSPGHLSIANSTFNGNSVHNLGGALYLLVDSSTVIRSSTFSANTAAGGDAIYAYAGSNVTIGNTIIDQGSCFSAGITSLGNNLDSDGTCNLHAATDLNNIDPLLNGLAFNGGALPVLTTQQPDYSSPAIDHGSSMICADPAVGNEDETGAKRPQDANHTGIALCDIGAVEAAARTPAFDAAPLPPGPINLGSVEVNKVLTASFTISDAGNYPLTVSNPNLGDATHFGVSTTFPIDVAVNQQKQIVLACKPTATGAINTTFVFSTTDADRPNASYILNCAGVAAAAPAFASIPPASMPIELGEVAVGTVVTQYLTIKNNGTANLNLNNATLTGDSGNFGHDLATSLDISPGASHAIAVACGPTQVGALSGQLLFHTNDGSQSPVDYHLHCNGVPPQSAYLANIQNLKSPWLPSDFTTLEAVATSPDGLNVYVTGNSTAGGQVVVLKKLTAGGYLWAFQDSHDYLKAPYGLAVSPDGKYVVATGYINSTLTSYQRDSGTGELTHLATYQNGYGGLSDMSQPVGVVFSPDSQFAYVAAAGSNDIVIFKQNPTPGYFHTVGVITATTMTTHTLVSPQSLVVSPDGKNVYVAANTSTPATDGTLAAYRRDTVTGALTPIQTHYQGECPGAICMPLDGLKGPWRIAISPDSSNVYVTGMRSDALVNFHRDPVTGLLTWIWNGGAQDGSGGVTGLNGPRGVTVSPDGKHVYATAESSQALTMFEREPAHGALTLRDVYTRNPATGYPALAGVRDVAVSSDGQYVFAASAIDDALAVFQVANPVPALYSLLPASVAAGGADFTLVVKGAGFVDGAYVAWDSYHPTTTYLNAGEIQAAIKATWLTSAVTHTILVHNPLPGGGDSFNTLTFQVSAPAAPPVPSIDHLSPASVDAGAPNTTVEVYGANFVNGSSAVYVNDATAYTAFVDSTHLRITILSSSLTQPGAANIKVRNDASTDSNIVILPVVAPGKNPVPSITSISPNWTWSHSAGSPQFTLIITGENFVDGAMVQWNGADRPTQFVDSSHLRATIYGPDQLSPGSNSITVENPAPGGGGSETVTFVVRPWYPVYLPVVVRH
jgi:6-phosphogluconolactonase (cycloisomerase 2 family)